MNARQTQGFALMLTAIGILVLPGALVNNLQANGVITNIALPTCPAGETLQGNFCVSQGGVAITLNYQSPCTVNPANCNLSGQSFQILNPCSTWANLLTLNFVGLLSSFFTNCGSSVNQGLTTTSFNRAPLPSANTNITISGCTDLMNILNPPGPTSTAVATERCTTQSPTTQLKTPFYVCFGCFAPYWNGVIGNSTQKSVPILANANINDSSSPPNFVVATCWAYGDYTGNPGAQDQYSGNVIKSFICNNFQSFIAGSAGSGGGLNFGSIFSFVLSLVGLTLLFVLALGINIGFGGSIFGSGTSGSIGSNPQGTKLAQTFGLGLLIWFPLYSTFDTWFTSGYLPIFNNNNGIQTGLDGNLLSGQFGLVSIILTVMMFLGLYFVSQSGGTTSQ